jgi:4,5:9,10-diseco-3-hydroxy-5,9,17-trioxoandrosta-1(10),2-diene-4-oate hydrolase
MALQSDRIKGRADTPPQTRPGEAGAVRCGKSEAAQDRYVNVGSVRTRYRAAGNNGPALVMLHGIGASLESWMLNLEPLSLRFRVYAPDLIWFGRTEKPAGEITAEAFSSFVVGFMDAMGLDRAILVGNSMGGMIATRTTLVHPGRVQGLVLVSAAGFGRDLALWLRLRTLIKLNNNLPISRRAARWAAAFLTYSPRAISDEIIEATMELAQLPGSQEAYSRVLCFGVDWRGLRAEALRGIRDSAHHIGVPTLIVWGKQDRVIPVHHARIARERIPNAELCIFDRCGHAPMIEKAGEFNRLVADFVANRVAASTVQ